MGCAQASQNKVAPEAPVKPFAGKTLLTSKINQDARELMDAKKPSSAIEVPPPPPTDTDVSAAKVPSTEAKAPSMESQSGTQEAATSTAKPTAIEVEETATESWSVPGEAFAEETDQKLPLDSAASTTSPLPSPISNRAPSVRSLASATTTRSTFSFAEKGTRGKVRPTADEIGLETITDVSPVGESPLAAEKMLEVAVHAMVDAGESLWGHVLTAWNSKDDNEIDDGEEEEEEHSDEQGIWVNPLAVACGTE
jgi:hypothetical protein